MPRTKWILPLVILTIMLATGCARHKQASSKRDVITLRVAVVGSASEMEQQKEINKLIRQHMQANYINIETLVYSTEELYANPPAESTADIFVLPTRYEAISLDEMQAIKHLDEAVTVSLPELESLLYKSAFLSARWQGHLIGIPRTADPIVVIYNIDHFKSAKVEPNPNWDWDEYVQTSVKIGDTLAKNKPEVDRSIAFRMMKAGNRVAAIDFHSSGWVTFLYANGGGVMDDNGNIGIDSVASVQALTWLQEQIIQGRLNAANPVSLALDKNVAPFGATFISAINSLNAEKMRFKVLPTPKSTYTSTNASISTTSLYAINADSANMDLAIDFVIASLNANVQKQTAAITGLLPVCRKAAFPTRPGLPSREILTSILDQALPQIPPYIGGRSIWAPVISHIRELSDDGDVQELAKTIAIELRNIVSLRNQPISRKTSSGGWLSGSTPLEQAPKNRGFVGSTITWFTTRRDLIPLVDDFNANQPASGVYVSMVFPPNGEDYKAFAKKGLTEKTADIIDVHPVDALTYAAQGLLMPLDKLAIDKGGTSPDGGIINQLKQHGVSYIIPIERNPCLVYTSKKTWNASGWAFPKNGWDWDEFGKWYIKSAAASAGSYALTPQTWTYMFHQMGGRLADGPYDPAKKALTFINTLQKAVPPSPSTLTLDDVDSGKAIAIIHYATLAPVEFTSIEKAELSVLPLPTTDADLVGGGNCLYTIAISAKAPHPDKAFLFLNWLCSQKASQTYTTLQRNKVPLAIYPATYQDMRAYWGFNVESVFPVPYLLFNEVNPYMGKINDFASSTANDYFSGELTLEEAVSAMKTTLPRIALTGQQ